MIEVPWASALREANPLSANVLLYWHMLKFSIERGFKVFDFGRSTPDAGTFHFKKQWGAEPLELVWEYWNASGTPPQERPFPVLTDREYEILDRLARGLRNDAISARMGISMKTVQNNVSTILLKLGAADRAQAVALARDAGMGRRQ